MSSPGLAACVRNQENPENWLTIIQVPVRKYPLEMQHLLVKAQLLLAAVVLETAAQTMAAGASDGGIKVVARPDAMYL